MTELLDRLLPYVLALLMVGVGLGVTFGELRQCLSRWKVVLGVVVSMQFVLPLLVLLVVLRTELEPPIAAGLVMLASCPGGLFSNYLTGIARGNVALSISLTALLTIIYALTAPLWASLTVRFLLEDATIKSGYDPMSVMGALIWSVLLPVMLGVGLRSASPVFADRIGATVRNVGALALILAYAMLVYLNWAHISLSAEQAFWPVVIFSLTAVLFGLALSRVLQINRTDRAAVLIEHVLRQEGTGIMIVTVLIGVPLAALPMLLSSLIGLGMATIVAVHSRLTDVASGNVGAK